MAAGWSANGAYQLPNQEYHELLACLARFLFVLALGRRFFSHGRTSRLPSLLAPPMTGQTTERFASGCFAVASLRRFISREAIVS